MTDETQRLKQHLARHAALEAFFASALVVVLHKYGFTLLPDPHSTETTKTYFYGTLHEIKTWGGTAVILLLEA